MKMQSTRITLFHVLWLAAVIAGAIAGFNLGRYYLGIIGSIAGCILGVVIGHVIGCLPDWLASRFLLRSIAKSSTQELKALIAYPQWNFTQTMALLQLVARGENIHSELPRILVMLQSDEKLERLYGWDALRIVFTEEYKIIPDYNPNGSAEDCRSKVAGLKAALAKKIL